MEKTQTEMPILEFDPADCVPPEGTCPAGRAGIDELAESIARNGQLVPALLCPHPEMPGKKLILDGAGRWHCAGKLGINLRGVLLPGVVSKAERIKLTFQLNFIRRQMTPDDIADEAASYIRETGATQEKAATELNISKATLSRAFSKQRRIPPELQHLAALVRPSIVAGVAALKHAEAMEKTLVFATTAGPEKRLPTREQVARFQEQFQERKARGGPKAKLIKGEVEGRTIAFSVEQGETGETLIEWFRGLADRLKKFRESPAESLAYLFVE